MHMHARLKGCIEDYGPVHSFWVFAFERYNGILESLPNNNRCIEPQIMQRFIRDIFTFLADLPEEFNETLNLHLPMTQGRLQDQLLTQFYLLAIQMLPARTTKRNICSYHLLAMDIFLIQHRLNFYLVCTQCFMT